MWILLYALVFITGTVSTSAIRMDTVYQWKYIDFTWESEVRREQAINSGEYNISQVLPMDVDKAPDGRVFISLLGMKGVPAVLATISDKERPSGPLVRPYPDWSYFKPNDCNYMQSIYRIAIDECERLWALDTGYLDDGPVTCEPQLLAFDLKTDRLIQKIKIPDHIAKGRNGKTLLATPIVETSGYQCQDTTVYMADTYGFGLVVWNNGKLFRLENSIFRPSKDAGEVTSGNFTVQWPHAGIVTMDLAPKISPGQERFLYFHSLASFDLHAATTNELKRSHDGNDIKFSDAKNVLSSQVLGFAFSDKNILFMGLSKESAIACWNRYRQLKSDNIQIVAQDNNRLQYVNGMKVIRERNAKNEELWTLSNRFLTFVAAGTLNSNDFNFHILASPVSKLIAGTVCAMPSKL